MCTQIYNIWYMIYVYIYVDSGKNYSDLRQESLKMVGLVKDSPANALASGWGIIIIWPDIYIYILYMYIFVYTQHTYLHILYLYIYMIYTMDKHIQVNSMAFVSKEPFLSHWREASLQHFEKTRCSTKSGGRIHGIPKSWDVKKIHPGRLTAWSLKMMVWFRWFSFLNGWWL